MPRLESLIPRKFRPKDKAASEGIQAVEAVEPGGDTVEVGPTTSIQPPNQQDQSPPQIAPRTDKYGLFPLHPEGTTSFQHVATNSGTTAGITWPIDVVALHGITGDAYKTWEHENGTLWLRDILPQDFPGSRVFSFGYDANVFFTLGTGNLEEFARTMLQSVKQTRVQDVRTNSSAAEWVMSTEYLNSKTVR